MNRFLFCIVATAISFNAAAGNSPKEDQKNGEPLGTVTLEEDGVTAYLVDDGETFGWTDVVTLPKGPNEYKNGIIVYNRGSKPTSVNTGSGTHQVKNGTSASFSFRDGKWVNSRTTDLVDGGPSGQVFIAPSKAP